MYIRRSSGPRAVRLEDGSVLTRADLPPRDVTRWVASRKARVCDAVRLGLISEDEACKTYDLSGEELSSWLGAHQRHGPMALRATALKAYREKGDPGP